MPKKLHEGGPVYPKQKIGDAYQRTSSEDLAELAVGFSGMRTRVQARLGDNNARKAMKRADVDYPEASGKKVPKKD